MVELTSKVLIGSLFYTKVIFGILATHKTLSQGQLIAVGESQRKIQALYLGTVLINIPKVKTFVIRTHILVGDKEMHGDMTVTILKYANTPH